MTTQTSARLTPDQIDRTGRYLAEVATRHSSPVVGMQVLFGRCCLASLSSSKVDWELLGLEGSRLAAAILGSTNPASLNLDPLPILEIYSMAKEQSLELPGMREILGRIVPELDRQSEEIRASGRVRSIARSLAKLGFATRAAPPGKAATRLTARRELWFGATAVELLDLADQLMASEVILDEDDSKILSLIALGELRNYRVDVGCKLLRTVFELGVADPASYDGIDFISLQRRRDGCYGFLDRMAERPAHAPDPELALYLPLTLNAVWLFRVEAHSVTGRRVPAAVELTV